MLLQAVLRRQKSAFNQLLVLQNSKRLLSSINDNKPPTEPVKEDYLAVHRANLYWFPKAQPTDENDSREIGPYPQPTPETERPYQLRPADLPSYFDVQNRRHYGEELPEQVDAIALNSLDIEGEYSPFYMLVSAGTFLGVIGSFIWWSYRTHDPKKDWRVWPASKDLPYLDKYYAKGESPYPVNINQ